MNLTEEERKVQAAAVQKENAEVYKRAFRMLAAATGTNLGTEHSDSFADQIWGLARQQILTEKQS